MTNSTLERLPVEILCRIAKYLHSFQGKHLGAFALASSKCQTAADSSLFSSLHLEGPDIEQLKDQIAVAGQILHHRAAHKNVRDIKIALVPPRQEPVGTRPNHLDLIDKDDVLVDKFEKERVIPRRSLSRYMSPSESQVLTSELNELIKRLPGLRSFCHDLPWEFDPSILGLLESRTLPCRIQLCNFQFHRPLKENDRDPPELRLLSSPLLHSIESCSHGYAPNGTGDFTQEAILDLIGRLNPALSHVSMLTPAHEGAGDAVLSAISHRKSRGLWAGLSSTSAVSNYQPARLKSLELGGAMPVRPEWIRTMLDLCNLKVLETLKLYIPYNDSALSTLASGAKFAGLSTLVLGLGDGAIAHRLCGKQEGAAAAFLASLNPLKNLRFLAEIDADLFDATLNHHGRSLRRLWFHPPQRKLFERFFTQPRLENLSKSCSVLEDLTISIARSKGDGREVAMYKTLGSLPMLKRLALTLDCDDTSLTLRVGDRSPPPIDPTFDQFDMEEPDESWGGGMTVADELWDVRKGHVRDAMINAALDERLARSIFTKLQSAKPEGARPLEHLELRPERGHYTKTHETDIVMLQLGRWWLVTQATRVDGSKQIDASRIRDFAEEDIERSGPMLLSDLASLKSVFCRTWPQNADSDDNCTADWCSWLLAD